MKRGLLRLLEVRRLLEERAALDLQLRAAELRRLEEEAARRGKLAGDARSDALRQMLAAGGDDAWLGLADAEIFLWQKQRTEAMARRVGGEVAALGALRMARRIETRQAETLVLDQERVQEREERRREQRRLDDWFQSRPFAGPRRLK